MLVGMFSQASIVARVRDPDAAEDEDENPDKVPPNAFWRVLAAFMYMIPWIDAVGLETSWGYLLTFFKIASRNHTAEISVQ